MSELKSHPDLEGKLIADRYRLLKTIGEGGMGTVMLAEHVMIKRRVAVKILHRELSTDAVMVKRFMNEARVAGTLGHPNIVEAMDMGVTTDHMLYIVFEYLEGTLLSDEVYRVQGLPIPRALAIADQIASACEAAHAAGVVHRDLKSDNVFLTTKEDATDHVTVIDFGISRFLEAGQRTGRNSALLGTLEFMAPEQITSPDLVDHRADIYSLGVLMYEMLAARLPFQLEASAIAPRTRRRAPDLDAAHAVIAQIVSSPPPPLVRLDAPPGMREMIEQKLLAKDPAHRYQSMSDVRGALAAFAGIMRGTITINDEADIDAAIEQLATPPTTSRSLLDPAWLTQQLEMLGQRWALTGNGLRLAVHGSMRRTAALVSIAAAIGDELNHHPSITLDATHLELTIYTRQVNAITKLDLIYAARLEMWLREHGY